MSNEISESKRLEVVRWYFSGLSYEQVAIKVGIGKATVFTVIEDLRAGRFPGYEHLGELVGDMRDMSVGMRKMGIVPAEGINLFILLKALLGLGIEPSQLDYWVEMCKSVVGDGGLATARIIQAAMKLAKLEADHRLTYEDVVARYDSSAVELKELGDKIQSSRTELTQLTESRETLTHLCKDLGSERDRLQAEKEKLTQRTDELSNRYRELEKAAIDHQTAVSTLEERDKNLRDSLPQLEERAAVVAKEIHERTDTLKGLESLGLSRAVLEKLHAKFAEMATRYGKEGLTKRFFENMDNYDSCLGLEATRESLTREVTALASQRDSLGQLGEKLKLTPEEIGEGIAALKGLQNKGVLPPAIISYNRLLADVGMDAQSLQKLMLDFGGVEKALASKHGELEAIGKQIVTEKKTLEELKINERGTKEYVQLLKESTVKEIKELTGSVKGEVGKLCQGLQHDIAAWGNVRGELGKCQNELKLSRYFVTIPLSEEATSSLVRDMDVGIVVQYLLLAHAWSLKKYNPNRKTPPAIMRKYVGIADYVKLDLADVITWALLVLAEGG